jgi:hypothetical protein
MRPFLSASYIWGFSHMGTGFERCSALVDRLVSTDVSTLIQQFSTDSPAPFTLHFIPTGSPVQLHVEVLLFFRAGLQLQKVAPISPTN